MIRIAFYVMSIVAVLFHLGLFKAVKSVADKILSCPVCLTMWLTFGVLLLSGYDILSSLLLSAIAAYLSNYMLFILFICQMVYNFIDKWLRRLRK